MPNFLGNVFGASRAAPSAIPGRLQRNGMAEYDTPNDGPFAQQSGDLLSWVVQQNPGVFKTSSGRRALGLASTGELYRRVERQNLKSVEDAVSNLLQGGTNMPSFASQVSGQVVGDLFKRGLGELFNRTKTTTTVRESDRSLEAVNQFRSSRNQEAVELLRMMEKAKKDM